MRPGRPPGPPPGPQPRRPRPKGPPPEIKLYDPTSPSFWSRIKYPLRWLTIAGLLMLAVFVFKRYELAQYVNQQLLRDTIAPLGPWAPLAFIASFVLVMLLMVIPYSVMAALGMLLFGMTWGIVWTVLGGTTAAIAVWSLSRLLGQRIMARREGDPRWQSLNQRLQQDGFYYLLLVRALSIVPFNLLNFACAFTAIRFRDFLLANLIGLIPSSFVYGYGAKILLDPTTPKSVLYVFVGAVALLLVTPLVFRQARKGRRAEQRRRIAEAFESPAE